MRDMAVSPRGMLAIGSAGGIEEALLGYHEIWK